MCDRDESKDANLHLAVNVMYNDWEIYKVPFYGYILGYRYIMPRACHTACCGWLIGWAFVIYIYIYG